jgi:hypothetical protein
MTASTAAALLFDWESPRRRNLVISGFLIASFAAHVACFYLFQVVYPPTVSLTPAPQRVSLISGGTDEGARLLRWVEAEDPALASTTRHPPEAKRYLLGKVQHVPSYFASEPQLRAAPPLTVDLRIPSVQPPGPVPALSRVAVKPIGLAPTKVTFSNEFDRLGPPKFVATNFKASTPEPPQDSQFRIAVDSEGAVRYCFAINSSGDAALDEQARQHLALCRFSRPVLSKVEGSTSNGDSLVWGIATIEWGNDIAAANSKSAASTP